MFENLGHFFKRMVKTEQQKELGSKDAAKERLHLVLMQDRANVSADFLELMKQEIIDVIKKYIVVDENLIDVRLTNQPNEDGTNGAPALYANIPIVNIKNDMMAEKIKDYAGIDFNKEMGLPTYEEAPQEKLEVPSVIELSDSYEKPEETSEEVKEVFEEVDEYEEDDDVTFDDLLKAAEEADKNTEENKEKAVEEDKLEESKEESKEESTEENKEEIIEENKVEEVTTENSETEELPEENTSQSKNKTTKKSRSKKKNN